MAKKEKDLHKELAKKKFKVPNPFLYWIYYVVDCTKLLGAKYNPHYQIDDKMPLDGPCFVIFNHQSRRDHAFVMKAAWPKRINMVCEYNEFFRSHLHFALRAISILPKKVFANDFLGMKAMNAIIKQGGCVAFSPEGTSSIFGCNQPIVVGTGKFLKHYGVPVYCDEIHGSYLTNNKVSERDRIGEVFIRQYLLFTPEDLKRMSGEEIDAKINELFHQDDYAWNKEHRIAYKDPGHMADHLSDICYKCPKCGKDFVMEDKGDVIRCRECGNEATINEYYDFVKKDDTCVIPESAVKWMEYERMAIIKEIRENPNYHFEEKVTLAHLPKDHWVKDKKTGEECGEGLFYIDHEGVHFRGTKLGEPYSFDLDYTKIFTLHIVVDLTFFTYFLDDGYLEFHPTSGRNIVGYMIMVVEEMHRLHVNYWKNFPWNDYMYEPYKK